ncbi:MAG: PCRF domain-containing protein, partial [Candidatus Acidiferrum sp.]
MAVMTLSDKLDQLGTRYDELTQQLSTAEVASDSARFQKIAKQHAELEEIVAKHREFKQIEKDLAGAHQMVVENEDAEMKQMALDEEKQLIARKEVVERELKVLLLPKDPNDEKSVIVEIRAGTGGDEAALFAAELFRMYSRYAETQGWKVEVLESSPSTLGGVKEIVAAIQGQKVYSKLKYESGVHRVQRVPATETQGRIHTSAATVAVLPEADDIDIKIEAKDLRIDTFCSSGPGGQSV